MDNEANMERYCFYNVNSVGTPLRSEILHEPWTIHKAMADFQDNTILSKQGIEAKHAEPILYFAKKIDVRARPLAHHSTNRFACKLLNPKDMQ